MKYIYYSICFFLVTLVGSCDVINPEEDIPAYLRIESFQFSKGNFNGSGNAKIPLAFVYINGEVLGIYELPITVPVIANGETNVIIDPGIEANGISSTPEDYPYYERFETNVQFVPGETITLQPVTTYTDQVEAITYEDFEGVFNTFSFDIDGNPSTELVNSDKDVFSGQLSGYIQLTDTSRVISVGSELIREFPAQPNFQSPVYLELNYKSDWPVGIGIIPYDSNGSIISQANDQNRGFNAKAEWNKIYFDFTDTFMLFRNLPEVASFRISITTLVSPDYEGEPVEVFLDELQLVWRK